MKFTQDLNRIKDSTMEVHFSILKNYIGGLPIKSLKRRSVHRSGKNLSFERNYYIQQFRI